MNYADIKFPDIQDGDGIRVSIYVSGCHFHCKECHNKEAWDFNFGKKFTNETIEYIMEILKKPYVSGLSLLGGEPLEPVNQIGLLPLVKMAKEQFPNKDIWCWTGYNFETDILQNMYKTNETTKELVKYIDIMIDGQFEIENKITDLKFRGSTNQRKIDVQESIKQEKLVRMKFGDENKYEKSNPKIMYFEEFKKPEKVLTNAVQNNKIPVNINQINNTEVPNEEKIAIQKQQEKVAAKGIGID